MGVLGRNGFPRLHPPPSPFSIEGEDAAGMMAGENEPSGYVEYRLTEL